jgi:hypothetical protein
VNESENEKAVTLNSKSISPNKQLITYTTSATLSLEKNVVDIKQPFNSGKKYCNSLYEP